jgi:hypothetical protein
MGNSGAGWYEWRRGRPPVRRFGGRVVSALFFFPRGGSAQVARALCRALPAIGWEVSLAAGSLGSAGEQGHAPSFFSGVDVISVQVPYFVSIFTGKARELEHLDISPARALDRDRKALHQRDDRREFSSQGRLRVKLSNAVRSQPEPMWADSRRPIPWRCTHGPRPLCSGLLLLAP